MVTNPKYYYYDERKDAYCVIKSINGHTLHFCSFKSEEAAKLAVEILKKTGWHYEDRWAVRAEVNERVGV